MELVFGRTAGPWLASMAVYDMLGIRNCSSLIIFSSCPGGQQRFRTSGRLVCYTSKLTDHVHPVSSSFLQTSLKSHDAYENAVGSSESLQLFNDNVFDAWLVRSQRPDRTRICPNAALQPVIQDFKELIERDAEVYMGFRRMFEEIPRDPRYEKDPSGMPQVSERGPSKQSDHSLRPARSAIT